MRAKKFLSLLMSLAMILTALPLAGFTAFAEDGTHTSGDFEYRILEDGTAEITDYTGNAEVLDIPSKLGAYAVTSIGYEAFAYCNSLASVTIPDSVTYIDSNAFSYCDYLTSVTIPDSVTSICGGAFASCGSLTSVTIPDSVTSIGEYAFEFCYNLKSVTIPNSVTSIGVYAFRNCESLTEINVDANNKNYSSQDGVLFDKNITEIIQYPIGNERTSYNIPNSVISIGGGAFEDCDNLTSVTIPNSVTSIGGSAFYECHSLTSVTIPESVTSIGDYAFAYCSSLTSITIPESVTSIGDYAFAYCGSLTTSITIPESVANIGNCAFLKCNSLTEIKVDTNNKNYSSQKGVLFDKNKTELIQYPIGNERTSYNIPNSVTSIGRGAFEFCGSLTSVTIPEGATNIDSWAFEYCSSLTSVTIPDSVTSIGESAFYGTGYYNNPSNWENGVLYIDNCLIEANNTEIPENYTINEGTRIIADSAFAYCDSLTSVTIPESVTSIGDWAFGNCNSLTSVTIPDSVISIGDYAFAYCSSLTSITIPESAISIGDWAFSCCYNLTSVTIGNSVTSIGDYAFESCDSLTSVTIPGSVTSIGAGAFDGCYILTDIYILNKDCNIVSSEDYYTIPAKTTIHGYKGSTAESYAEEHGNDFDMICNHSNMKKVEAKAATCTEDGNVEYYHCSECNRNYEDINGNEEITDVVVNATGHKFENGVCTVCGEKEPVNPDDPTKPDKPVTPEEPNAIGDVDGNTDITITDAKWILQNTVKSRNLTEAQAKAADLNKDGKVTIVDAKWVLQIVVGLRDAQTLKPIKK